MGLQEKRWAKKFEDEILPRHRAEQEKACGFPIALEIRHESFEEDGQAYLLLDNAGIKEACMALRDIAKVDDLGRDALKKAVKKVVFANAESAEKNLVELKGGTVNVHWAWGKGKKDLLRSAAIKKTIESLL